MFSCCFTGHRPQNLLCGFNESHPICLKIKYQLRRLIIGLIKKKNVTHFISGAALGVDMWAMEIILELKKQYSNITLEAAVPCRSQPNKWNIELKEKYKKLLSKCDKITILQEHYTNNCMIKRNKYMVDKSDFVIAVWNGTWTSGTGSTIKYALYFEKPVYYIDTINFKINYIKTY